MERDSRSDRLAALVVHARRLLEFARPTTACILRVLNILTVDDIEELGKWELDKHKSEGIVDRLAGQLGEQRQLVREALGRCLRFDVWRDCSSVGYEVRERAYRESGMTEVVIEKSLGTAPKFYPFLHYLSITTWEAFRETCSVSLDEDNHWRRICEGYLVAKGRAFQTTLALLEGSAKQEWAKWPIFWKWF